jgi:hypothetical protein
MWHDNRVRLAIAALFLLALILTGFVAARLGSKPPSAPAPTVNIGQIQTQAVLAFANGLTSTALALPTSTTTSIPETPTPVAQASESTSSVSPTPSCYRLKFLQDVTIPDDTLMTPAEVFTKTWQVQNNGTCAWRPGFQMILIGGLAMGGSPYTTATTINPGSKIEISITMVAPTNQTGIVQGTWRMTDGNGNQFGDALTAIIVVPNGSPVPPTVAATATP